MTAPLVVVTGTGTGIGKTYAAAALVATWHRVLAERGLPASVAGLKPVESGGTEDGDLLGRMSTFHVKRFQAPYLLRRPVSPHLAARDEGIRIDLERIRDVVDRVREEADAVVVELPGGLYSPLDGRTTNADLTRELAPSRTVLVAPDRLGVLHDVTAALRASSADGVPIHAIVLSSPLEPDASTGTNATELAALTDVPVAAVLPRADLTSTIADGRLVPLVERIVTR